MSDIIDVRGGIPNVRPSRALPQPFQRPRLEVGSKAEKRQWRWAHAREISEGDIVQEVGRVDGIHQRGTWAIWGGDGNSRYVLDDEQVWAFTLPPKPVDKGESEVGSMEVRFDDQA